MGLPMASLGRLSVVVEADVDKDAVGLNVEDLSVVAYGDGGHAGLNDAVDGNVVEEERELVATNGGSRNLGTDAVENVGGDIGVVLGKAGVDGQAQTQVAFAPEWGLVLHGADFVALAGMGTEAVKVGLYVVPVGEVAVFGRVGVGPVDVVVGELYARVDGNIVGVALALVHKDVVEDVVARREFDAEGAGVVLGLAGLEADTVEKDVDVGAVGVEPDACRGLA